MNYGKRKLPPVLSDIGSPPDTGGAESAGPNDTVKRKFRNLNEKKRRDQFNMLINELSGIVCPTDARRIDKTTILQQAISFLEHHTGTQSEESEDISYNWKPSFLSAEEFVFLMLEAMDCVTLAIDNAGKILSTSENAQMKLGIAQDVLNMGSKLQEFLSDELGIDRLIQGLKSQPNKLYKVESLIACEPFGDGQKYQAVDLVCIPESEDSSNIKNLSSGETFNCVLRLKVPCMSQEVFGPPALSFKAKHSLELKILFMENKSANVLGYQPFEILGTSGYDYYHPEDLEQMAVNHKKILRTGCSKTSYYRMLTKSQHYVWMQSDFYMCYNQWTGKPEHIEAVHRVALKDLVEKYKKDGPTDEKPPVKRVKVHLPTRPTSAGSNVTSGEPQRGPFSAQLADIGIRQNRDAMIGRMQRPTDVDSQPSLQAASQALTTPQHLSPAAQRLHQQLANKYFTLRASIQNQQQELSYLYQHLSLVSAASQSVPMHSTSAVNPQQREQIYQPNYSELQDQCINRQTGQMNTLPIIDVDDQVNDCTQQ